MAYYDVLTGGHPVPRLFIPQNSAREEQTSPERSGLNRAFRGLKRSSNEKEKSHKRDGSSISSTASGQGGPSSALGLGLQVDMPAPEASPIDKGVSLLATLDGEQLCRVDISGSTDARIVKELMYTRLHIMDEDHSHCTVHRGHFNQVNEGPALTDSELWDICQSAASQPSPPILLVRISGPIKGYAAPLLSPNNTAPSPLLPHRSKENSPRPESSSSLSEELVGGFFLSENRVASPREPTEELRSAHPQWHKARTSDPSSVSRRSQLSPISSRPPVSPERHTDRNSSGSSAKGWAGPQLLTEQRRTSAGSDEWWEAEQRVKKRQEEAAQRQRDIEWQRQLELDAQRQQRTRRISLEDVPEKERYLREMGHPRSRSHAGGGRPASEQAVGFGPSGPYYSAATVPGRSQPSIAFQPSANRNFSQPMAAGFGPSGPTRIPRQQPPQLHPPQMPRQLQPGSRQSNNPFTQIPDSLAAPRRPLNNAKSMDDLRGGRRNIPPPPDFNKQSTYPDIPKQRNLPPRQTAPQFPPRGPFAEQHSLASALPGLPGVGMSGIQQWRDQTARESHPSSRPNAAMMRPNNSSQGPSRQQRIVSPEQLRPSTAPISQIDRFGGPPIEEHHRWRMPAAQPIGPPSAQIDLGQRLKLQPGGVLSTAPRPTGADMRTSSSQDGTVKPRNQFMTARDPSLGNSREAHARNELSGSGVVPVLEERPRQQGRSSRPHTSSGGREAASPAQIRADPKLARSAPSGRRTPGDESNEEDAYGGMDDSSSSSHNRSSTPRSHPSTAPSTPVESPPNAESAPPQRRSLLPSPTAPVLWENDFLDPTNPDESTLIPRLPQVATITNSDEWDDIVSRIRTSQPNDEGTLKGPSAIPSIPADDLQIDKPACPTLDNHFASFSDDDDDDADGDTWAKPLDPVNTLPKSEPVTPTRTTPRPTLRIKTGSEANSPITPSRTGSTSAEPSKPFDSEREDKWAVRPSVEHVYEDLERFFPDHDLDKPIVDAASTSPATSPQNAQEDTIETDAAPLLSAKLRPKKSIRVVAQDRKKFLQKAVSTQQHTKSSSLSTLAAGLLRRKSTKLWGSRLEEVTPSKGKRSLPPPLAKEDASDPQTASIKWVKGELIGKGSYGKVYLALNVNSGEMLAVKQVEMPQTSSDKDNELQSSVVAALHFEIETLKDLDHANIVQFLGQEQTPQYLSIFLEYVPGGSVGRCIRKHGKFEKEVVQYFTVQILSGLSYLHGKGVLHRDLKADNILVDLEGNCKISDFGISKRSDDIYSDKPEMSMQGSVFWMAPEVIHNGKRGYSAKVDIWSLGCVALEMIGGKRPWNDEQLFQALYKLGAEKSAPPIPEDANLCEEGRDFLEHCFTVDPASRPTAEMLLCHPYMVRDLKWRFAQSSLGQALVKHRKTKSGSSKRS